MSRWLRWQIVVPRLLLCLVAGLGAHLAVGLVIRSLAMRSAEQLLGTKVDVANARVSLADGHMLLGGIRVADPRCPDECWFTAEACELALASRPLLARRLIVPQARMSGMRLGAPGERASADAAKWYNDHAVEAARDRLAKLDDGFGDELLCRLESVRRASEFSKTWLGELAAVEARAAALEKSAAELEKSLGVISANQLRHDRALDESLPRVDEVRRELESLRDDFEKLPASLEEERRLIVAARRKDEQLVRDHAHFQTIDDKLLNAYLLREPLGPAIGGLVDCLRGMRQIVPAAPARTVSPQRGEDLLFAGMRRTPHFLVQALELQGEARIGDGPIEFRGLVSNLTTMPSLHDRPIELRFSGTGAVPLEVRAIIDRTGGRVRDALFVDCEEMSLGERSLGAAGPLRLQVAPSTASLTVSMSAEGNQLCGEIQLVQKQVRITPVSDADDQLPMDEVLGDSIANVNSLATRVSLGGTIEQPACALWSNLGSAVAQALESGMQRKAEAYANALLTEARRQVDERLTALERQLCESRDELSNTANDMAERMDAIARAHGRRERISVEQAGRRLPTTSILR
jgi:uncharacterized protein (TIGR03545 family)